MANYKTYTVLVDIEVHVKNMGLVVQDPGSVASAVRHAVRIMLPQGWRKNGLMFNTTSVSAEAKEITPSEPFKMLDGNDQRKENP